MIDNHVAFDRTVFTYEPDGWPRGVITGHGGGNEFYVEHIVVFPGSPPGTLDGMLASALCAAREFAYRHVRVYVHARHPIANRLLKLAATYGCVQQDADGATWWTLEVPE